MNRQYELMLLLSSKSTESDFKKILDKIKKELKENSKITDTINLGKKNLAYILKKETTATYWLIKAQFDSQEVALISNKLKIEEQILRYLFVKILDHPTVKGRDQIKKE